jgi:hypothetical protein
VRPSSEAEPRSRGCPAPERGGALPGGGDRSSSEAGSHPRGRPTLERGGISLEGSSNPRAGRKSASGAPCPSSETEFYLRVAELSAWWAAGATRAVGPVIGPWVYLKRVLSSFAFCFCERKWISPTYSCPRHFSFEWCIVFSLLVCLLCVCLCPMIDASRVNVV